MIIVDESNVKMEGEVEDIVCEFFCTTIALFEMLLEEKEDRLVKMAKKEMKSILKHSKSLKKLRKYAEVDDDE